MPEISAPPASGGRHRKPRAQSVAVRRALLIAAATPVAGAILAGPSAYAADKPTAASTTPPDERAGLDAAERKIAANLDTRVKDKRLGTDVSGVVLDAQSNKVVWGHNATTALMPASNAKLATATAALAVLGPDHRFTTRVVYGDGTLTLIGGGDRVLTTADITSLAQTAAQGLKFAGLSSVKVRVDDSLFPEPTLANGWNQDYFPDSVAPVRALVVDGHGVTDTSLDAGGVFAKQLAAKGITVDGDVTRGQSAPSDVPVATHSSPALSEIVKRMLKTSDNNIAETLLRMTALRAGQPATFEGGTQVVRDVLSRRYGVSTDNFEIHDGSGLSRADRIPAATIADILDAVTDPANSQTLGSIEKGLPVAGEAGSTLGPEFGRFDTPDSACAVGKVKAKTGTLTGASALSGLTQAADGRWKVFSFIENNSTASNADITNALDGLASTVNGCRA
jgi:D-alanyl-D-alanine carboxypeptidase/D-alanyl-D-alanine-endopeptidase (penicillin-binding protein 4)